MLEIVSELRHRVEKNDASVPANYLTAISRAARRLIDAADSESRTNGHRALILVAALKGDQKLLQEIKGYLCREANEEVLMEALWTYLHAGLPAEAHDTWLAAALVRATSGVKIIDVSHNFLNALPEPVRCRVVLGRVGLGGLTVHERMLLLDRRLQALAESDSHLEQLEPFGIEGALGELLPFLDDDATAAVKGHYRRLVLRILTYAEQHGGEPIRSMGEYACNVLVEPIARLMTDPETSLEVFEWTCQLVEEQTGARDLVNRLRVMGHLVRAGVSWRDAGVQVDAWSGVDRIRMIVRAGGNAE